ncbi:hypothetical protein NLJ89_g5679 [Agrocybe chaxingu]|uniref:ABC transporter domain-containing protein n=1 Tax=Agrocybe chaxingu TaxID=84603 RepID=A0A9W8K200_9AGAR|nr:hypothetical protein NLJ89_g5679 [Agrocybe chaxingu]
MGSEKIARKSLPCDVDPNHNIRTFRLGVWVVRIANDPSLIGIAGRKYYDDLKSTVPLLRQLATDVYGVAPGYFVLFLLCQLWQGIEDAVMMIFSNLLLTAVEVGIKTGKPDQTAILTAIFARLFCSLAIGYFKWHGRRIQRILETKVTRHYELFLMTADLKRDLPTSQKISSRQSVTAAQTWEAFDHIMSFLIQLLRVGSQLALIARLFKSSSGPLLGLCCIAEPLFLDIYSEDIWNRLFFAYVDNGHYERMQSLKKFTSSQYRQDIVSAGLTPWIINEFKKSHESLGETPTSHPLFDYDDHRSSPVVDMLARGLGDLPLAYCGISLLLNKKGTSLITFAVIQQSSMALRTSVQDIFTQITQFRKSLATMRALYTTLVINTLTDGNVAYPRVDAFMSENAGTGMSFSLRNISFSYPDSQNSEPALRNVSLSIGPGEFVVIVGANGSGKSTLIRVLSRLYDPDSGEIYIDNLPSKKYRINDLHQATALLSQDTVIYPLSIAENIGLGFPECIPDQKMIEDAAREGGAFVFIKKLKNGMDTILDPYVETFGNNLDDLDPSHPLFDVMERIEKRTDISGGERQKVVASRSFMRFKSGKVKFVAVDEPSSALDADAELKLFQKLIAARAGKTLIFVTHRFGHLTKYADRIICMKDGSIVEMGRHEELMQKRGEYANLYEIQASAFSDRMSEELRDPKVGYEGHYD